MWPGKRERISSAVQQLYSSVNVITVNVSMLKRCNTDREAAAGNTLSGVQNRAVTRVIYTQEPDWK